LPFDAGIKGTLEEESLFPMDAFLARQPILNRELQLYGYELLFRNGAENYFQPVDGNLATASLISDAVHIHNLEKLTDGCLSFINFPRNSLVQDLIRSSAISDDGC
jgi:c-di-GMP-related signal transduction protein